MNKKVNQLVIHVLGCAVLLAFPLLFTPDISSPFDFINDLGFIRDLLFSVFLILFFYFSYYILVPKLYFNKKYILFFSIVILCFFLIFFATLFFQMQNYFNLEVPVPPFHKDMKGFMPEPLKSVSHNSGKFIFQFLIVLVFSLLIKINNQWKQTENEKLDLELSYLRSQINPHFLFNTLNSIYSLAIVRSDNVAPSIVKLSNMMRYVLNESSKDFVSLEKEIEYIQSYIELQQIRFGSFIHVECDIIGETKNKRIAPLIMISFIENAYKHGVNAEGNSSIKININISENELFLSVKNNKVFVQRMEEFKSGLGVKNTKNRLQYNSSLKHKLVINDNEKEYSVSLTLDIK